MINTLRCLIQSEENKIKNSYPNNDRVAVKLLTLELIRLIDCFYACKPKYDAELSDLYSFGWNEVLGFIYNEYTGEGGFPLSPSTKEAWDWANYSIQQSGRIAMVKKIITLCESGLVKIENAENKDIVVNFNDVSDWEGIDRKAWDWFENFIHRNIVEPKIRSLESAKSSRVWELVKDNVDRWKQHFIQYESTPEIDDYFSKKGHFVSLGKEGRENFSGSSKFGDVEYKDYCLVIEEVIGIALKHVHFCSALCEVHKDIDFRNIISIPKDQDAFIMSLSKYLGIELDRIRKIVCCLTLSFENCRYFANILQGSPPLFVKVGGNTLVHSIAGSLCNPYDFLNRELRRRYEKDYFIAVNNRESFMREELYFLFNTNNFQKTKGCIVIGEEKIKTDIDAAIFDLATGTMGIFQLKWQETFGSSIRERNSRLKNFYQSSVEWIDKISLWLKQNKKTTILSSLHFDTSKSINKVLFFVINWNAVFFTGVKPDQRAAWTTIYQLIRNFSEIPKYSPDFLSILHSRLLQDTPVITKKKKMEDESPQFNKEVQRLG